MVLFLLIEKCYHVSRKVLEINNCLDGSKLFDELKGIVFMPLVPIFLLASLVVACFWLIGKLGCCLLVSLVGAYPSVDY